MPVKVYNPLIYNIEKGPDIVYVLGTPVDFVLSATAWNGTIYELTVTEYGEVGELQIGIPTSSSIVNAQLLEQCAMTIAQIENSYTNTDTDGDGENDTRFTHPLPLLSLP